MITNGLKEFELDNKLAFTQISVTASQISEVALPIDINTLQTRRTILEKIIAVLIESKLEENKEQRKLETQYDFNFKEIIKEIEVYLKKIKKRKLQKLH